MSFLFPRHSNSFFPLAPIVPWTERQSLAVVDRLVHACFISVQIGTLGDFSLNDKQPTSEKTCAPSGKGILEVSTLMLPFVGWLRSLASLPVPIALCPSVWKAY
jgi:hypothetical protein